MICIYLLHAVTDPEIKNRGAWSRRGLLHVDNYTCIKFFACYGVKISKYTSIKKFKQGGTLPALDPPLCMYNQDFKHSTGLMKNRNCEYKSDYFLEAVSGVCRHFD